MIPHSGNNILIPDEVFYNKKVNIKQRTFGCTCYFRDQTPHKFKFKPNSRKGIFLGFDKKYSYIIMDKENRKLNYVNECIEEE